MGLNRPEFGDVALAHVGVDASSSHAKPTPPAADGILENLECLLKGTFNFANSILGAGIIGMPFALRRTGLLVGIALMMGVAWLTAYSSRMLVMCGHKLGCRSYEDLCEKVLGKKGYICVLICMAAFAFGGMTAYLIIIGDTLTYIANAVLGPGTIFGNRHVVVALVSTVLVLPISSVRDLSKLAHLSFLGLVAIAAIVLVVLLRGPAASAEAYLAKGVSPEPVSVIETTLFAGIGTMSFAFVCNHSAFLVFNSMDNPTPKIWNWCANLSVGFAWFLCALLGISGYVYFRADAHADILSNFPENDVSSNIARSLLAFTMVLTYPMEMFVARHCLLEAMHPGVTRHSTGKHMFATLALWLATTTIALAVPRLGLVIEVTGALSASCLGYILPGIIYLTVTGDVKDNIRSTWTMSPDGIYDEPSIYKRFKRTFRDFIPVVLVAFGAIAMIAGTATAFL